MSCVTRDALLKLHHFRFLSSYHSRSLAMALNGELSDQTYGEKCSHSYQDAISKLNSLQSNASVIEAARKERQVNASKNLTNTRFYLQLCGITDSQIDNLKIIHVAGTKGKGSTCAFVESILRQVGFKTGLYTSPHLIAARERIKIDGRSLSQDQFTDYFWSTYHMIDQGSNNNVGIPSDLETIPKYPSYFMFLTIMAFKTFIDEKVDVAVIEVGIGGEFDVTNFIKKPFVTGITSLALDHTSILGNTIEKISWNKSGIFKKSIPAYSVPQESKAMKVLERRAAEKEVSKFQIIDSIKEIDNIQLGIPGHVQKINASLAVALCQEWLRQVALEKLQRQIHESHLPESFISGLKNCRWPGRYHIHRLDNNQMTYFLDGAHTIESIKICCDWFFDSSIRESNCNQVKKVLLFNCTGNRNAAQLLAPFLDQDKNIFDLVIFSTNRTNIDKSKSSDNSNFTVDEKHEIEKVLELKNIWNEMNDKKTRSLSFNCLSQVLDYLNCSYLKEQSPSSHIHVLVTGSLHLVGGVLSLIDPNLDGQK